MGFPFLPLFLFKFMLYTFLMFINKILHSGMKKIHPFPSRQQVVSLSKPSYVSLVELTDEREGLGVKAYDSEKAWSSMIHSILSVSIYLLLLIQLRQTLMHTNGETSQPARLADRYQSPSDQQTGTRARQTSKTGTSARQTSRQVLEPARLADRYQRPPDQRTGTRARQTSKTGTSARQTSRQVLEPARLADRYQSPPDQRTGTRARQTSKTGTSARPTSGHVLEPARLARQVLQRPPDCMADRYQSPTNYTDRQQEGTPLLYFSNIRLTAQVRGMQVQ